MIGTTVAHFKVTAKLGEGGMGQVFRATDTKLDREVAIKVLPEAFTNDPERLARFEREAKVLASLNHPHIAGIHGLEEVDGQKFLILELVEGESLADRIARGKLPAEEALELALQMAQGLEAAHEQGIVHRDFKPANVQVTPDGQVKILDFGLAKAMERSTTDADFTQSPTLTAQMTGAGVLMGTAAYMSPEQARGTEADKRADIWAFGVVLFEMLSGKMVYSGKTVSDILAGILAREPEWKALPADTPAAVQQLLHRCLEKEAFERMRDIGEARIAIERFLRGEDEDSATSIGSSDTPKGAVRSGIWRPAAAVLLLAALASSFMWWRQATELDPMVRASINPPEGTVWDLDSSRPGPVSLSPDGRQLAFVARDEAGTSLLWVQNLGDAAALPLANTEGAAYPFWSPDSKRIGFFASQKLKKVDASGSPPVTLCGADRGKGGSWNQAGDIIFAPSPYSPLHRVAAGGGESVAITELDSEAGENSHRHPRFLPDGRRFLYLVRHVGGNAENVVRVRSLDGDLSLDLMQSPTFVEFAAGHLLFVRESTLMARPFDPKKLEFRGDAFPLVEEILDISGAAASVFAVTDSGLLAYQVGSLTQEMPLVWIDREGRIEGPFGDEADYGDLALSPDGRLAAVSIGDEGGQSDIWIYDMSRELRSRFTFNGANEFAPRWSPDSRRVYFTSNRDSQFGIYVKGVAGGLDETLVHGGKDFTVAQSISPNGQTLVFSERKAETGWDLMALSLGEGGEPIPLIQTEFQELSGRISPDGRWMTYHSRESGESEIYVTRYPSPGAKWQVSTAGGTQPAWRADGREILYRAPGDTIMAAEITFRAESLQIGKVIELFSTALTPGPGRKWSPTADGQRFLIIAPPEGQQSSPIHLVLNWQQMLEGN
ncbi:MAG: protein kinase [Thermoanaerobaculia bacterium]